MRHITLLLILFILVGCGKTELERCIDSNISTKDNKLNDMLSIYVKAKTLMRGYEQYLEDLPQYLSGDYEEIAWEDYLELYDAYNIGHEMLSDVENSIDDETLFDEANSEALNCFFYGDDYENPDVYDASINYGKEKLKRCYEKNIVDAEGAEKICNRQGIY